jgi:hypothetical protein
MQVRISRVVRNGKTYQYAQLVESYRRPDGMPTHRVVANLGSMSETDLENLRVTLRANRQGKRVVVARTSSRRGQGIAKILDNLRYLDVAVLRQLWDDWDLATCFEELMPVGEAEMAPGAVVAALAIQRCVAPGSKRYATKWMPDSALPELLGFCPSALNNTRVHRVLDDLDEVGPTLMAKLAHRYQAQQAAFAALFVDVTDTWFVGHGPELAQRAKTKEGMVRRKIGIVLLCNEHGYPLRWEVIEGRCADSTAMHHLLAKVAGVSWTQEVPIVADRAMGNTAHLAKLHDLGIRFVSALTVTEFSSYTTWIPEVPVETEGLTTDPAVFQQRSEQAASWALAAGLEQVTDSLFVRDLGCVQRILETVSQPQRTAEGSVRRAMELCRQIDQALVDGRCSSDAAAGRELGLGKSVVTKYRALRGLSESLQREVLAGRTDGVTLTALLQVAREQDEDKQREAFEQLVRSALVPQQDPEVFLVDEPDATPPAPDALLKVLRVRLVAAFNPERFIEQRSTAARQRAEIESFTISLNAALAKRARKTSTVLTQVDRKLRQYDLVDAFEVTPTLRETACSHLQISLRDTEWARRRRYDGWMVIVAHPELPHTAAQLAQLYRDKDMVEKDFGIIKGLVELRPVHHRNDAKVRAHVTICMLALLLERTLAHRLNGHCSAQAALETLEPCCLNRHEVQQGQAAYTLTTRKPDQDRLLRLLRMQHLADEDHLADAIHPR